jgi:3-deoxy-D-manno-octulosonic-acid transferase
VWYGLYNILLTVVFILALPCLPILLVLGPRYRNGLDQRLGFYSKTGAHRADGFSPVWIHAASLGEVRSVATLVHELKRRHPQRKFLLSTFTATGHQAAKAFADVDAVIFLPLDLHCIVRRTLTRWNPALVVFIETEIWPNFLRESFRRGIPTILLSGRISERSFPRYSKVRFFFGKVLGHFSAVGMQSSEDEERILKLGALAQRVSVVGSLKFAYGEAPSAHARFDAISRQDRKLIIAGSTHEGEEEILVKSLTTLRKRFPRLGMVLAPRHPERFADVEKLLKNSGLSYHRKSQVADDRLFERDVLLLDTLGELQDFFAFGDVAFVGGSMVDVGGHNVLEPARFAKPVLFGPYMSNYRSIARELQEKGGAIEVRDTESLVSVLSDLLSDDNKRGAVGQRALSIAKHSQQVLQRNLDLAERYL